MHKKNILFATSAGVAIAIAAFAFWHFTRPPLRSITTVSPIGPNEAVLVTRNYEGDGPRHFLEAVRADGERVWETEITPIQPHKWDEDAGIAADTARVYVVGQLAEDSVVLAFDRRDGRELWRHVLRTGPNYTFFGPMLAVDGEHLIITHRIPEPARSGRSMTLTTLNTSTGELLWPKADAERIIGGWDLKRSLLSPGRLLLSDTEGPRVNDQLADFGREIDTATGTIIQELPIFWGHQTTPRGILGLALEGIYFFPRESNRIGDPILLVPASQYAILGRHPPIGIFEDLAILGITPRIAGPGSFGTDLLLGIELTTGVIRWKVEFKATSKFQDSKSTNGELPRMLPVGTYIYDSNPSGETSLDYTTTTVDLKTGTKIAERSGLDRSAVLTTATRSIISERFPVNLDTLDPTTGAPLSAAFMPKSFQLDFVPESIKFNQLWYYGYAEARPGDLPWGVIDLPTWTLIHENGVFAR